MIAHSTSIDALPVIGESWTMGLESNGTDWLAVGLGVLGPLVALMVVFVGGRMADRRLKEQIAAQRATADERWKKELELEDQRWEQRQVAAEQAWRRDRDLEARKWVIQQRRDLYARHLHAISEFVTATQAAMQESGLKQVVSDELSERVETTWAALEELSDEIWLVASQVYFDQWSDVEVQLRFERHVLWTGKPEEHGIRAEDGLAGPELRELRDLGRAEVNNL